MSESYLIETSEGTEHASQPGYTYGEFETMLDQLVEQRLFGSISSLVDQVRSSEEQYLRGSSPSSNYHMATICAERARRLLDLRYGPLKGVMNTPPVVRGRWQW